MIISSLCKGEKFMTTKLTFMIEKDLESGKYIGSVPYIKGAHTYADSLDELKKNIKEVLKLCSLENLK